MCFKSDVMMITTRVTLFTYWGCGRREIGEDRMGRRVKLIQCKKFRTKREDLTGTAEA